MSIPVAAGAALAGGVAGAFVPRVAHRLAVPAGTPPRSACGRCARPFPTGARGWARAGASCACGRAPWPTVLVAASAAGLLGFTVGPSWALAMLVAAVVPGVLLAEVDVRCLRLPDRAVGALAVVLVPPPAVRAVVTGDIAAVWFALMAGGLVGLAYLALAILSGGAVGPGDVKLAAVLALALGFAGRSAVAVGAVVPHLIAGPIALVVLLGGRARRRTALPFGPALLAGALIAVVVSTDRVPP